MLVIKHLILVLYLSVQVWAVGMFHWFRILGLMQGRWGFVLIWGAKFLALIMYIPSFKLSLNWSL